MVASGCLVGWGKSAGSPALCLLIDMCRFALSLVAIWCGLGWPQMVEGAAAAAFDLDGLGDSAALGFEQKSAARTAVDIFHFQILSTQSLRPRPAGYGCDGYRVVLSDGSGPQIWPVVRVLRHPDHPAKTGRPKSRGCPIAPAVCLIGSPTDRRRGLCAGSSQSR